MCIGVVTTIAVDNEWSLQGVVRCIDAQSGKHQLVVTNFSGHRLCCVDLQTGTNSQTLGSDLGCARHLCWIGDVWRSGAVSAFAGSGEEGHTNTSAALSQFFYPQGVCLDASDGSSVICSDNYSVRAIKNGE